MEAGALLKILESERRAYLDRQIESADTPVQEILKKISENLLDTDFEVAFPDLGAAASFHDAIGLRPGAYLFLNRVVIAACLLCETVSTLEEVARLSGFKSARVLHYHCERFLLCSPGQLRKAARIAQLKGTYLRPSLAGYQRYRRGDSRALEAILSRLEMIGREAERPPRKSRSPLTVLEPGAERVFAAQCRALDLRPHEERLTILRRGIYGGSRAAFDALCRRSREIGRHDRGRGVELAEMALALVEGNFERLGEEGPGLLALAWARLGNARRLAADFEGSSTAFRRGEAWLEKAGKPADKEAEILALKGSLRLYQRLYDEALELLDEAAALSEALGSSELLVDVLHQRAATNIYRGDTESAIPDLKKARSLITAGDHRRRLMSYHHYLLVFVQTSDTASARRLLPEARQISAEIGDRSSLMQFLWIEGLCFREEGDLGSAESLLLEAREGYLEPKDPGMLAIVALELALLYLEQDQPKKVMTHAAEALPALEALSLPEAAGAYKLLREAVIQRQIARSILEQARQILLST